MSSSLTTFVAIFRQGPFEFSDADKTERTGRTGAWAREFNGRGHKLNPHILTPDTVRLGVVLPQSLDDWPVTALLMLEASNIDEAKRVAELHPALAYNANVEIRAWGTPAQINALTAVPPPTTP